MLTGFQRGRCREQNSMTSTDNFKEGLGGNMHSFCAKNSLRLSFCVVPLILSRGTPCLSPTHTYMAKSIGAGPLIVILVLTLSSGMPSNRISMSFRCEIATPHCPTSPSDISWSESYPMMVG